MKSFGGKLQPSGSLLICVAIPSPQKHDPPLSSIPCLHYKKMKDNEEREQNSELTPSGDVSPIKPLGRSAELEFPLEEPESIGTDSGPPDEKDPLGTEAAPGALGQVKAKVEVCKDESVGKFWSEHFPSTFPRMHLQGVAAIPASSGSPFSACGPCVPLLCWKVCVYTVLEEPVLPVSVVFRPLWRPVVQSNCPAL